MGRFGKKWGRLGEMWERFGKKWGRFGEKWERFSRGGIGNSGFEDAPTFYQNAPFFQK
jgi:hypothetical protein